MNTALQARVARYRKTFVNSHPMRRCAPLNLRTFIVLLLACAVSNTAHAQGTLDLSGAPRSQLAMIEAVDATSPACMNAVGAYRASVTANSAAEDNLQSSQMDGEDTTISEVQQLNLLNASQAQHLVEQKQQGTLQACQAQQAAIANMQQRNAAANDLNTWGFVAQQRAMTNNNSAGSSTTWTTYLP